jgi:hypothetical protein
MLQLLYTYVAVALHICCKCMLQMFHPFQTYVAEVLHVATLAGAGASAGTKRTTTCIGALACRGGCVGAKLHAGQAGQIFFGKAGKA